MLWLAPAVQVYAGTLADAHCRTHGHAALTAPDAAAGPIHAAQASGEDSSMHHAHHGDHHTAQAKCECLCGLACAGHAAMTAGITDAGTSSPERFAVVQETVHPHAEPYHPQRPPAALS